MWRMSTAFCLIALFTTPCELVIQACFSTLTHFQTSGCEANVCGGFINGRLLLGAML